MTDRHHRRAHLSARLPVLPPDEMAEVVRAFAAALRQAREEETEKLLLTLYGLEFFHDGMIALLANMRDGRLS
jgi:hypothetical protein